MWILLIAVMAACPFTSRAGQTEDAPVGDQGKIADKPLFRDPVYDGAADPVLCWSLKEKKWFMFYTNRRANMPDAVGVSWVHGTAIGIAESSDGGATWKYRTNAKIDYKKSQNTYWAPEVIEHDGVYHMYLTYVPGIFKDWNAPRDILHLTSRDLLEWKYQSTLRLSSNRVIDACAIQLSEGGHPDVVISGGRAYLFYFTHPGRKGPDANKDTYEQRRSSIQVVELELKDGWLACDRDKPTHILLQTPERALTK